MGDNQSRWQAGYRTTGFLLVAGCACIGFARLEDRGIIGPPGAAANAMVALANQGEGVEAENYEGPPEDVLSLGRARRAPGDRLRRILADRSLPNAAARQIVANPLSGADSASDDASLSARPTLIDQVLPSESSITPAFTSSAPPLLGTGSPVFAADVTPSEGGGTSGGSGSGSGSSSGGGGSGGGANGGSTAPPVTPVPEPSTWLLLMLGLFGVGAALRRGGSAKMFSLTEPL